MRIALGVEYDGRTFSGWESQVGRATVQTAIESALSRIAAQPVSTTCAGRTDAGVHAIGQVIHFDTAAERPMRAWLHGVNRHLPKTVNIVWARPVSEQFHARFGACARHYRYLLLNQPVRSAIWQGRAGWECRPLRSDPMRLAANFLLGEHDFSSFRASGCKARSPVRRVLAVAVSRHGDMLSVDITATAFLQHMVRNIVGTLVSVGIGKHPPGWIEQLLEIRDRRAAGVTMSADGLYLIDVRYPSHFRLPRLSPPISLW